MKYKICNKCRQEKVISEFRLKKNGYFESSCKLCEKEYNKLNCKKYHIDHIIPCIKYDLSKENEQKKCFNYKNLRLLDAKENIIKKDILDIDLVKVYQIEDLLPENLKIPCIY